MKLSKEDWISVLMMTFVAPFFIYGARYVMDSLPMQISGACEPEHIPFHHWSVFVISFIWAIIWHKASNYLEGREKPMRALRYVWMVIIAMSFLLILFTIYKNYNCL